MRWATSAAAVVVAAALATAFRGAYDQSLAVAALTGLGCAVGVVAWLTRAVRRRRGDGAPGRLRRFLSSAALVLVLSPLSLPVGWALHRADVQAARAWCDELIGRLEEARERTGRYPADVAALLPPPGTLPRLIDSRHLYLSDGASYVVAFDERATSARAVNLYSSTLREWRRF